MGKVSMKKKVASTTLCVAFVIAMLPVGTALATNADQAYSYTLNSTDIAWGNSPASKDNSSSVYVKGKTTGVYICPAAWSKIDKTAIGPYVGVNGNAYIANYYPYFIRNYIYENYGRVMTNICGQTYGAGGRYNYTGVWSPDSVYEYTPNADVWP